jgi:hypothetical protein
MESMVNFTIVEIGSDGVDLAASIGIALFLPGSASARCFGLPSFVRLLSEAVLVLVAEYS